MAARVLGPETPSTSPGSKPWAFSADWVDRISSRFAPMCFPRGDCTSWLSRGDWTFWFSRGSSSRVDWAWTDREESAGPSTTRSGAGSGKDFGAERYDSEPELGSA